MLRFMNKNLVIEIYHAKNATKLNIAKQDLPNVMKMSNNRCREI